MNKYNVRVHKYWHVKDEDMPFHSSGKQDFHSRCFKMSSTGGKCINAKGKDTNQKVLLGIMFAYE